MLFGEFDRIGDPLFFIYDLRVLAAAFSNILRRFEIERELVCRGRDTGFTFGTDASDFVSFWGGLIGCFSFICSSTTVEVSSCFASSTSDSGVFPTLWMLIEEVDAFLSITSCTGLTVCILFEIDRNFSKFTTLSTDFFGATVSLAAKVLSVLFFFKVTPKILALCWAKLGTGLLQVNEEMLVLAVDSLEVAGFASALSSDSDGDVLGVSTEDLSDFIHGFVCSSFAVYDSEPIEFFLVTDGLV